MFIVRQCDSPERRAGLNLGVSEFRENCRSDFGIVRHRADIEPIECGHKLHAPTLELGVRPSRASAREQKEITEICVRPRLCKFPNAPFIVADLRNFRYGSGHNYGSQQPGSDLGSGVPLYNRAAVVR